MRVLKEKEKIARDIPLLDPANVRMVHHFQLME